MPKSKINCKKSAPEVQQIGHLLGIPIYLISYNLLQYIQRRAPRSPLPAKRSTFTDTIYVF